MKGVPYYYDENGEPTAVLIDLKKNPEVWEEFQDMILEKRQHEPHVSAEEVHAKLQKKRKKSSTSDI
jgi:hypothetical protein